MVLQGGPKMPKGPQGAPQVPEWSPEFQNGDAKPPKWQPKDPKMDQRQKAKHGKLEAGGEPTTRFLPEGTRRAWNEILDPF